MSTCVPGLEVGERQRDLFPERVEQPVVGEDRRPGAAVDRVVGLDQSRQLVLEHDRGASALRREPDVRRVVIDEERQALALASQGVVGAVRRSVAGDQLDCDTIPDGNAVVSQAYVFSRDRLLGELDPLGPAVLADVDR